LEREARYDFRGPVLHGVAGDLEQDERSAPVDCQWRWVKVERLYSSARRFRITMAMDDESAMTSNRGDKPLFAGPHEGRELELMLRGAKPLSMFVDVEPSEFELFPEQEFDSFVSKGKLVKRVQLEATSDRSGKDVTLRRILYALPHDEWRIDAFLLVQSVYDSLCPGWRPDLDRVIGLLLGYDREDIEKFLQSIGVADR
jgi:hypothetical protein